MHTGLNTPSGGKISVHFGTICTTNLWNGKWYVITDSQAIADLKAAARSTPTSGAFQAVQAKYPNVNAIGTPYIRGQAQSQVTKPQTPQSQTSASGTGGQQTQAEEPLEQDQTVEYAAPEPPADEPLTDLDAIKRYRIQAVDAVKKFFSEFPVTIAARQINTMARCATTAKMRTYLTAYYRLTNHPDVNNIIEKMKSEEFSILANNLIKYPPDKKINDRLRLYFGPAGTGKTTQAQNEFPNAPIVPCNSSILPDELLRTFDFNDANGNPVFKPSDLRLCMENGEPIIFDEINLLSFDCLRLLQTLTDGKRSITYNNETIEIQDGFEIIGTMNLVVNDQVYSLPEPLVDRAECLKEFKVSNEDLVDYAF